MIPAPTYLEGHELPVGHAPRPILRLLSALHVVRRLLQHGAREEQEVVHCIGNSIGPT